MSKTDKLEFNILADNIINNNNFKALDNELHHGISRYDHSIRVAKATYYVSKRLHLKKTEETVQAALLHDYYLDKDLEECNAKEKLKVHPSVACKNAINDFEINEFEQNIIKSHMFPLGKEMPKYKESVLVSMMDKCVASYEMYKFKFSLIFTIWALFIFNMITLQK